ncbi:MAG TPA: FAD-dependent oxidoreductase [Gammaproteobacteria bacterium]|nr:FAD-dependent oxidoreductase [Gammaproteobacteria bacterium]
MARYLVVGSGLIGRLLSWRLSLAGHQVDILSSDDKVGRDSAGYIAAAMIAPATEAVMADEAVKELGDISLKLWPLWLKQLSKPIFYHAPGTLVVAHHGDSSEMTRYQHRVQHILGDGAYTLLDKTQLAMQAPSLAAQFHQAMWFDNEAYLDNRQLFTVLGDYLTEHCCWRQSDPIQHLSSESIASLTQHYFSTGSEQYAAVIDCRGNGAIADMAELRSVRGEIIRVRAPEVEIRHAVRLLHPRYPLYLAPRPDNEYVLGATVLESADRSPVSVRSSIELMSALYSLDKGFSEARILELSAHCRPGLNNNLPKLIQQPWGYQLNGFYRHGYLFGPAMVSLCLTVLAQQTPLASLEKYYE